MNPTAFFPVPPKISLLNTGNTPAYLDDFAQIICSAIHGDMPFKFEWLFNNESIDALTNINIDETRRSSTLTIESITGEHAGNYSCLTSNKGGSAYASVELIVKGSYAF